MRDLNGSNFGIVIAWLIPGFVVLWGIGQVNTTVDRWLRGPVDGELTVGGFLYVTLASLSLGLIVSTIRWALIDTMHHRTGLPKPRLEFANLHDRTSAFARIVEDRYRFYQWYSNTAIAIPIAATLRLAAGNGSWAFLGLAVTVEVILLAGSRDTLKHYYLEIAQLLGTPQQKRQRHQKRRRK